MSEGMIIEGVGEEVIQCLIFLIVSCVPLWIIFKSIYGHRNQAVIHTDSEEVVAQVRNDITNSTHSEAQNEANSNIASNGDAHTQPDRHYSSPDSTCPICLANILYPVETNCGHMFCANCIITYWNMGRWSGAIRCPSCRQQVTLLLRCFNSEGVDDESLTETVASIRRYNRLYSGEPISWLERIRDLPTLLRHMATDMFSLSGLLLMFRLRILICLILTILYLLSPLDLLPEAVFGLFGFIDDVIIIILSAIYTCIIYRHIVLAREAMGF